MHISPCFPGFVPNSQASFPSYDDAVPFYRLHTVCLRDEEYFDWENWDKSYYTTLLNPPSVDSNDRTIEGTFPNNPDVWREYGILPEIYPTRRNLGINAGRHTLRYTPSGGISTEGVLDGGILEPLKQSMWVGWSCSLRRGKVAHKVVASEGILGYAHFPFFSGALPSSRARLPFLRLCWLTRLALSPKLTNTF